MVSVANMNTYYIYLNLMILIDDSDDLGSQEKKEIHRLNIQQRPTCSIALL